MEQKPTKGVLEAMAREIREAALEYSLGMQATRAKRRRLFEAWENILNEKKATQVKQGIYGAS